MAGGGVMLLLIHVCVVVSFYLSRVSCHSMMPVEFTRISLLNLDIYCHASERYPIRPLEPFVRFITFHRFFSLQTDNNTPPSSAWLRIQSRTFRSFSRSESGAGLLTEMPSWIIIFFLIFLRKSDFVSTHCGEISTRDITFFFLS